MATRWIEGFEVDRNNTYLSRKYASAGSAGLTTAGRLHGFCATQNATILRTPSLGLQNKWTLGIGHKCTLINAVYNIIFYRGATEQIRCVLTATSGTVMKAEIKRGATVLATVSNIPISIWHYFEFQATVHTTAGTFELRQDGVQITTATGVNTANAALNQADVFEFGASVGTHSIDDIYIVDDTGAARNSFLGDQVVEGIGPTSDGASTQWTPQTGVSHFAMVDDADTTPNDVDYNGESTVGERDLYGYSDLAVIQGTINGVMLCPTAALDLVGSRQFKCIYRDGAAVVGNLGPTNTVASTVIAGFPAMQEINPNTGNPWTIAEINAAQFGVELVS